MIPAATAESSPAPVASSTRTGMIFTPGAPPAMPIALFACAAMIPAMWVPWPFGSVSCAPATVEQAAALATFTQSAPVTTLPTRSSWSARTPVSMTATVAPVPVVVAQAEEKSTASNAHCAEKSGSFVANVSTLAGASSWTLKSTPDAITSPTDAS